MLLQGTYDSAAVHVDGLHRGREHQDDACLYAAQAYVLRLPSSHFLLKRQVLLIRLKPGSSDDGNLAGCVPVSNLIFRNMS
jgi:hypothetical protein